MKEIIELAAKNQQKAWEVVRKTDIINIWKSIGAEINLVGSIELSGKLLTLYFLFFYSRLSTCGVLTGGRRLYN